MFGFETVNKKSLIIVCDEPEIVYANYLVQLIGQKDDVGDEIVGVVDGSLNAAIFTVKQYKDSMSKIPSSQRVVFIGPIAEEQAQTMDLLWDAYGMRAAGLGKRRSLYVLDVPTKYYKYKKIRKIYQDFRQFSEEKFALPQTNALEEYERSLRELDKNDYLAFVPHVGPLLVGGMIGKNLIVRSNAIKEMKDQKYKVLMKSFYLLGLKSFMEG